MAGGTKPKIFISYSRDDSAFADALEAGLKAEGRFDVLIDRHSMRGAEDWKQRLGALIRDCDTVIFVLSPDSMASEICAWEVDEAFAQSKRIIPALWRPVDFSTAPHKLAALNAIPCDGANALLGMRRLIDALDADLEWLSEYTRIAARSAEWDANGRDPVRLLRGAMLAEAHTWLARRPERAPEPTEVQLAFLSASDAEEARLANAERAREELLKAEKAAADAERARAEEARRSAGRTRIGAIVAGTLAVIATGAGVVAFWQSQVAQSEREIADVLREFAEENEQAAIQARAEAQEDRSQLLAAISEELNLQGNAGNALVLAWMALPHSENGESGPVVPEAMTALRSAREQFRETLTLRGHRAAVADAVFSPDGSRIVTVSYDSTGRLWDAVTGELVFELNFGGRDSGYSASQASAAFSSDGGLVALTFDWGVTVWDSASGDFLHSLGGDQYRTHSAAFEPSGERLVTASDMFAPTDEDPYREISVARVWNARTGELVVEQPGALGMCAATFSPDGQNVTTISAGGGLESWNPADPSVRLAFASNDASAESNSRGGSSGDTCDGVALHYSPDGSRMVSTFTVYTSTASQSGWRLWDTQTRAEVARELQAHAAAIVDVAFNPSGEIFATASDDRAVKLWFTSDGFASLNLQHEDAVTSVAFSRDGRRIVTTSKDDSIRIWDAQSGVREALMRGHESDVLSAAFDAGGDTVVTASVDGTARLWRLTPDFWLAQLVGPLGFANALTFDPTGDALLVSYDDGTVGLWTAAAAQSWSQTATLPHLSGVLMSSFRSDGRAIVTATDVDLHVWESDENGVWSETAVVSGAHESTVRSAVFSRDGNTILTSSDDTTARVWTQSAPGSWTLTATLSGHTDWLYSAVFSADERRIATASEDGTVRVWAADGSGGWAPEALLEGHTSTVYFANFNPTRDEIVSASNDTTARVWARAADGTWAQTALLEGHTDFVSDADYSPDGNMIVTVSNDQTARLWGRDGDSWRSLAVLRGFPAGVYFSAFSPDGTLLAMADAAGVTSVMRVADAIASDLDDEELIREAGQIAARRQLSEDLCARYDIDDATVCAPPPTETCPCLVAFGAGDYATAFAEGEAWVASIEDAFTEGEMDSRTAAAAYGQYAWYSLFAREFEASEAAARRGLEIDPTQSWIYTNLAHSLAFRGRMDEAYVVYDDNHGNPDWNAIVAVDIQDLRAAGVEYPEMDAVLARMNAPG